MTLTAAQKAVLKKADEHLENARTEVQGVLDEIFPTVERDDWEPLNDIVVHMEEAAWELAKLFSDSKEA
ncbi:MAG: hypothetical protein GX878_11505 [Firmicutes bacterium]|nr:hypothetical protein [Bacillota bacterium]